MSWKHILILIFAILAGLASVLARGASAQGVESLAEILASLPPPTIVQIQPPESVCGHDRVRVRFIPENIGAHGMLIKCGEYVDENNYIQTCVHADAYTDGMIDENTMGRVFSTPVVYPPTVDECLPVPEPPSSALLGAGLLALLYRRHG